MFPMLPQPTSAKCVYLILTMNLLRSIVSFGFAFLVLVSSTQFMVGIHRCGGQVQHVAIFDKADACPMEAQVPPCHRISVNSCCQDVTVVHEDEDFSVSWNTFPSAEFAPDAVVATTLVLAEVVPSTVRPASPDYSPPLRSTDRTVALQVFLI